MFARRSLLDRHPVQNVLVAAALAISVVMLTPQLSPVLGDRKVDLLSRIRRPAAAGPTTLRFGYLPPPARPLPRPKPVQAKGIYMSGYTAGGRGEFGGKRFDQLLKMIDQTEINAVVIDIKDERGEVSWIPRSPAARAAGPRSFLPMKIEDPAARIRRLKRHHVYVIGRIVTFQDPIFTSVRPDLALQKKDGGVWTNDKGLGWLDPYSSEAQDYDIALAVEAAELGFDEIQFDYVRFPSDGDTTQMWSRFKDERSHAQAISDFLARARKEIVSRGAYISADLFGLAALARDDLGIGQRIQMVARHVDYISLMLYPSHFHKPEMGIPDPEKVPYQTVSLSLEVAKKRLRGTRAKLRPWLQDFTLEGGVPYSPKEVRDQIEATQDQGIDEWLLWNVRNRYSDQALISTLKRPPPLRPQDDDSLVAR